MDKRRKWQRSLIIGVLLLTLYNILPTVFFYCQPLSAPIDASKAKSIAERLADRVNTLERANIEWLGSFCNLLGLKPARLAFHPSEPQLIEVEFHTLEEAQLFRTHLPRAGELISFVPAQLSLYDPENTTALTVAVSRNIPLHFEKADLKQWTQFSEKWNTTGSPTPLYRGLVEDRALQLGMALAGPSENAALVRSLGAEPDAERAALLAQKIITFAQAYGEDSPITSRYFSTFTRLAGADRKALFQTLVQAMQEAKTAALQAKAELEKQQVSLDTVQQQTRDVLSLRETLLSQALTLAHRHATAFTTGSQSATFLSLEAALRAHAEQKTQRLSLSGAHPFIESLAIDWESDKMFLQLYPAVEKMLQEPSHATSQLLYNEIALISRQTAETIAPRFVHFEIPLAHLKDSHSFLALKLGDIGKARLQHLKQTLIETWNPSHPDLTSAAFPIYTYEEYLQLPAEDKEFGLILYMPAHVKEAPLPGFQMQSAYVIVKGANAFMQRVKAEKNTAFSTQFHRDWKRLNHILQSNGFLSYTHRGLPETFAQDLLFECEGYYQTVLKATREDFSVQGSKRFALLEFTNVEQRILTENKIDDRIHEDLLKSHDDYDAAHLGIRGVSKYDVPKPTQSALWSNITLSARKYVRGDDKKILRWGLDLSGGKTVQIELRDSAGKVVTDPLDIKQGVNELYNRVNKMGVSEVSIRQEGHFITLDFPGSQGLSASELVKASSMHFHIVNEQFGPHHPLLYPTVNAFLQEIWNEATITGKTSTEDINLIACNHLYGEGTERIHPRTETARALYQQGLKLAPPHTLSPSGFFDNTYSTIRILRGEDFTEWQGQSHPLVIVFHNFALEGSSLEHIHAGYDPTKGNFLSFGVRSSYTTKEGKKWSPSDDLFAWTSVYSKEKIAGTPLENYSLGRGWRMAVILNERIVSSPGLESALRDSGMITGSFTQREIAQLETDLKAGSLSFTPHILSENNVSPELGTTERTCGIIATGLSLLLVMGVMTFYYRFAGIVASVALLCNLLIMWATLQNLHATMTLAGLAGIILTLAMAVDANVLVFERIREEFTKTGRISAAIHAGYKKAFSAIIDANVTTVIAAMILLNFDSGPIKALAIMLIIGIISSLFTALFMTRFFFSGWALNPQHQAWRMRNWFQSRGYNFLKHTRKTVLFSAIVIAIGGFFFIKEKNTLFGMDFTGGYAVTAQLVLKERAEYRTLVEEALSHRGVTAQEAQVRELNPSNTVRILLSRSLELPRRPFFNMPLENDLPETAYPYQRNPKLVWLVEALRASDLEIESTSLQKLDTHWTEVSGQMSEAMRVNASIGLCLALVCVLIYITIRFEFKYAISATLCLVHDLLFTLCLLALLHALGGSVQIDLSTVAALLTIVGYSLNDTIIIFDRIREDTRLMRSTSFAERINHALNITLSRTLMTSGTTLLVLIPMMLLGGSTLFGFSLVMAIGVVFGTLSSLFIAAPLMKYFHDRELRKEKNIVLH